MYQVVVFVHVLCAIIWVGGAFYSQLLAARAQRSPDPDDLPRIGRHLGVLGSRVFMPASLLLFIAGVVLVIQAWSFGQLWIAISMGLWVLSALIGSMYIGPRAKKAGQLFYTEGPSSVAARAEFGRVLTVSRLELVSFAIIVALMVFKPGAGG